MHPKISDSSKTINLLAVLIISIGGVFYCYEFLLRIIPGALESELSEAYGHVTAGTFGQISAFYYFAYSPMQLPVGMLMDRYGPRRLLTFACFSCTVGSYLYTFTDTMWLAASGRFLVGFGSSFAFVGVLTLTTNWLPRRYFSFVVGLITTMGMLGLVYGEIKISQWSANLGWEYVLYLMIFLGAGLSILIFLLVRDGPAGHSPDVQPWPQFFYQVFKVVTSYEVWLIGVVGACLYTSLSVFGEMWGKTYLMQAHHLSNMEAAKTVSSVFFGWAIGAPLAGFFSDNSGRRVMPLALGAIGACVCISLVLYFPNLSYMTLNILLFFYGLFSAVEIIVFIMAKENSGAELSGTVFAVTNLIVTLGGVIFQPLVGKILDMLEEQRFTLPIHQYSVPDFQIALSVLPISMLLVTIVAFFLKDVRTAKG
ncbi:MFS transporter [Legionella sp. W05-934-2]|jgi:MFS family permease|uniref:MFS transporter n=1 Tax=Legionella sp. W05-934-2 TaxID=1198649 RepID=UPI0034625C35